MLKDGEKLKSFLKEARQEVLLCAPFIKAGVIKVLFSVVQDSVPIKIITRWRASEVALGVSDLEVYDLVKERPNTQLYLLDNLHAKLYLADEHALIGSANLTAAALGWSERSNLELLLPSSIANPEIRQLLSRLENAIPATFTILSQIKEELASIKPAVFYEEAQELVEGTEDLRQHNWLPKCAVPEKLFQIYSNPETNVVIEDTRKDSLSDIQDLDVPSGLDIDNFKSYIASSLILMPAFSVIIEYVPKQLNDSQGIELIKEIRPDLSVESVHYQWHIVREWIREFFSDKYEVAPDSFVIRLK